MFREVSALEKLARNDPENMVLAKRNPLLSGESTPPETSEYTGVKGDSGMGSMRNYISLGDHFGYNSFDFLLFGKNDSENGSGNERIKVKPTDRIMVMNSKEIKLEPSPNKSPTLQSSPKFPIHRPSKHQKIIPEPQLPPPNQPVSNDQTSTSIIDNLIMKFIEDYYRCNGMMIIIIDVLPLFDVVVEKCSDFLKGSNIDVVLDENWIKQFKKRQESAIKELLRSKVTNG